jgi:predicted RecB family nuclease
MAKAGDPVPFSLLDEVGGPEVSAPRLWRRRDIPEPWGLTRRDVELDVDMESAIEGAYLWGTLLSYPRGDSELADFAEGYRGFGERFAEPSGVTVAEVFLEFLTFVESLRAACQSAGRTLGIYCYAGRSAEVPAMRKSAAAVSVELGIDVGSQVDALVGSDSWIDLFDEVRARVQSLNGLGLKIVAKATGFAWNADDAGGEASMRWYAQATTAPDHAVREAQRKKILRYNEDDVEATRHLREWFEEHGPDAVPPVP